jgi:hypothetical protein
MTRRNSLNLLLLLIWMMTGIAAAQDFDHREHHRISTINGLLNIQQIGSSENILDANGLPITVDSDPYKIAVLPQYGEGRRRRGEILVSNVGNAVGMTIVEFGLRPSTGIQFNAADSGVRGPSGLAFDRGKVLVANSKGNSVQILNADGTLFTSVTDPLFNKPWSVSTGFPFSFAPVFPFFTSNKIDAKILRVDVIPQFGGVPNFKAVQIGQFGTAGPLTKIDVLWTPFLRIGSQFLVDVLLALDPVQNRVAAFPHSSGLSGTGAGMTVFQGAPLNNPGGLTLNPINGDILVVNLNDNNLVELNPRTATVVGVKAIDPLVVDAQGNNSALFGVAAVEDEQGNLRVYFTDDNTNTLNVLSAKPISAHASLENDDDD